LTSLIGSIVIDHAILMYAERSGACAIATNRARSFVVGLMQFDVTDVVSDL